MARDDNTLLARMGFQDADRRDGKHDLACSYLAEEAQAKRVAALAPPHAPSRLEWVAATTEKVVTSRSGFVVGFVDVLVRAQWTDWGERWTLVEVKIARVSVGELLRQLRVYEHAMGSTAIAAALAYDLTRAERETLRRECVPYLRLGEGFAKWCAEREGGQGEPDARF